MSLVKKKKMKKMKIKISTAQETLQDLYNKPLFKKAESILSDCSHPLHQSVSSIWLTTQTPDS